LTLLLGQPIEVEIRLVALVASDGILEPDAFEAVGVFDVVAAGAEHRAEIQFGTNGFP